MKNFTGIVAIGRNEGRRLVACLNAIRRENRCEGMPVVYVDSGSSDDSVTVASKMGIPVVELSSHQKFSAARARNAGFRYLLGEHPSLRFVQFIDGDSELAEDWLESGTQALQSDADIGLVCGHVLEKDSKSSIYKRMAQIEWTGDVGDIVACGGNAMSRVEAFQDVGGFDASIFAAEDDELCLRLRRAGFRIHRLDSPMVTHDTPLRSISQWWKRSKREGQCYIQVALLHGAAQERLFVKPLLSAIWWGSVFPLLCLLLALSFSPWMMLIPACVYTLLGFKAALGTQRRKRTNWPDAVLYGFFCVLGKFPQVHGIAEVMLRKIRGTDSTTPYARQPEHALAGQIPGDPN